VRLATLSAQTVRARLKTDGVRLEKRPTVAGLLTRRGTNPRVSFGEDQTVLRVAALRLTRAPRAQTVVVGKPNQKLWAAYALAVRGVGAVQARVAIVIDLTRLQTHLELVLVGARRIDGRANRSRCSAVGLDVTRCRAT